MDRTMRVANMGADAGLPCTPHCANLSLVTLFTMHLLRAIPNAGKYLEFSIEGADFYPWQEGLYVRSPYDIVDGKATVTDEPGWGVEISPEWLDRSEPPDQRSGLNRFDAPGNHAQHSALHPMPTNSQCQLGTKLVPFSGNFQTNQFMWVRCGSAAQKQKKRAVPQKRKALPGSAFGEIGMTVN